MDATPLELFNADILDAKPLELFDRSYGKKVKIITRTGFEFEGILKGFDAQVNCVLEDVTESLTLYPSNTRHFDQMLINGYNISLIVPNQPPPE